MDETDTPDDRPQEERRRTTGARAMYERDAVEFSRATAFFDATFALATTLLVTTLDPGPDGWSSWSALIDAVGNQLLAFGISFAVVAGYWWLNHTFVSSLRGLSPRVIGGIVLEIAFIVLVPFTTEGMALGDVVPTVVYAVNVALVSLTASLLYVLAWKQDLFLVPPERDEFLHDLRAGLITPAVFLASVPVALLVSSNVARWCWIALIPLNMAQGRADKRRAERAEAAGAGPGRGPGDDG